MLDNTLMKSYCIVLPYKCIGLHICYVYLHHCMCHYIINISPKSSPNTKFLTSECFPVFTATSEAVRASHLRFHELAGYTVFCRFFCYLAKIAYYKRFSASHKLFGCDSTTNDMTLFSAP